MKKAILSIAMIIFLAVMVWADDSDHTYTATVQGVSNIVITELDTAFGTCVPGSSCTQITDSLNVQNQGNTAPTAGLNGTFLSTNGTIYGLNLTTGADCIAGDNFDLNGVTFTDDGTAVQVIAAGSLTAGYDANWTADLSVPAGQASGSYSGTIRLTWTA